VILLYMFPKTVKEAAALILSEMSGRDKLLIRNTKKEDLIKFHLSWGNEIRNRCGLWDGNDDLMKDARVDHPDSVSTVIMEAVWEELRIET
jgi:hypothetical protein